MPAREFLEPVQLARLLDLGGMSAHPASPIARVAQAAPCDLEGPGGEALRARGLVVGDPARSNSAFRGVLEAAARPEEVLTLQVSGPRQPGFSLCRRGTFWTECTVGPLGVVKLEYPLTRGAMIVAAGAALSGERDEAPPVGFRFRGPGADLSVLHAIVDAGRDGIASDELAAGVRGYLEAHAGASVAAGLADPTGLRALATESGAAEVARRRLEAQGLVATSDGRVVASRSAVAALRHRASAGFVASRTTIDGETASTSSVQVWRAGERNLVVRAVRLEGGAVGIEARDIGRAELRALVAAVFSDDETLARATAAGSSRVFDPV